MALRIRTLLALLALACSNAVAQPEAARPPGTHELLLPGSERRYVLVVPEGYSGREPVPLILSLHFGGRVTPFFARGLVDALIAPALEDLGALIVAPDSAAGSWANAEAEQHVLELLDHVASIYNIDSERTLVTGYSMGGTGTWYLAPRHPERFRAALAMAGRPQTDSTALDWEVPFYVLHSRADELVPLPATLAAVEQLREGGAEVELVVVEDVTHFQVPRFRSHLKAAIPWLRAAWSR